MPFDRRTLLAGLTASAALTSTVASAAPPPSREEIARIFGDKLVGDEQIALLLYPGMTALDLIGPYHFLASMAGATVHLVTNQSDLRPVPSDLGLALQPTVTMGDCPADLTLIFCPGGTSGTLAAVQDKATLAFIRDRASRARYVTSVCTGSLILGSAGLLKGKRATSHWSVVPLLTQFGATPVSERVVRDGKVITAAGVSAGMDFGATLVAELRGKPLAELTTLIAEYDPEPPFRSGSPEAARPEIAGAASGMLERFVQDVRKLKIFE